jgi:hypothetical protein
MLIVVQKHAQGVDKRADDVVELVVPQHGVQQWLIHEPALLLNGDNG